MVASARQARVADQRTTRPQDVYTTKVFARGDWDRDHASARRTSSLLAAEAASAFTTVLSTIDREARRAGRTVPTEQERSAVVKEFWDGLIPMLKLIERGLSGTELDDVRRNLRNALNPWLLRGRYWNRSFVKPHGYAGDFRILEWMYDLELDECADRSQPALVNLLDELFRSVHSVQAVWHRREWFSQLIANAWTTTDATVRLLDVACGGSRYIRDVIDRYGPAAVDATFVDQDPAALAFVESWLEARGNPLARLICAPVRELTEALASDGRRFDIVIATGVCDYVDDRTAVDLVSQMAALVRPGGAIAISNFSPDDESRIVKDWILDWPLVYRDRLRLADLFGSNLTPGLSQSPDGAVLYAKASS
ncbi:MAG TPA: class I SAM-dependent methyltransferase [Solirubrobacteraceae bacterium]